MKILLKTYGVPALCGTVLALSFPSWHLFPLAWVALAPLFFQAHADKPAAGFKRFFLAGWVFHSILLQWLITNIYWAGGWAIWGYQIVCLVLALYWGIFGLLWTWVHRRVPRFPAAVAAAALWIAMEYGQATLLTGFGWSALGYSQGKDSALLQWASIGGVTLLSAVLIFFNALVGLFAAEKRWRGYRAAGAAATVLLVHGLGTLMLGQADYTTMPLKTGLIQANFALEMKFDREYYDEMVRNTCEKSRWLHQLEPVDLFVWPESLVMTSLDESPAALEMVGALTRETQTVLFTGSQRVDPGTSGYRNSSFLVNATGAIMDSYDKVHLAPFGEYVPFREYVPILAKIIPSLGDLEPGDRQKVLPVKGRRFGPLICFEVLFGPLAEELRELGADFLVVITNLGWFGGSNAIPQELEIARLRAVETRLPVVHCTNTGITGVFDPWGRFTFITGAFGPGGHHFEYPDLEAGDIRMNRFAGTLPVAAPGKRLIPFGPQTFPWLGVGLSAVLLVLASVYSEKAASAGKAEGKA
ncbi:MAG: Apolipoprotein N-acyltransferase [Candidatus Hydrogenedentes bacterium]|nr:Apolipoprotein N-acyltransferase [Candidatus Hydrogenedentota bacterium]